MIEKLKIHNKLLFLVAVILFLIAIYFLYSQISARSEEFSTIKISLYDTRFYIALLLLVVLQFINWLLEAIKLKLLLSFESGVSLKKALVAVYVGNFTAFFTPDRLGTFIGRFLVINELNKLKVTALTAIGNLSQLIITVGFGLISFLAVSFSKPSYVQFDSLLLFALVVVFVFLFIALLWMYMNPYILLNKLKKWQFFQSYVQRLASLKDLEVGIKLKVLGFSFLRFVVFYFQYLIIIEYLNINFHFLDTLYFIGLLYGLITFIPSPFLGNFGTREALALYLTSYSVIGVFGPFISFFVWLINVGVSTAIGGILLTLSKVKAE